MNYQYHQNERCGGLLLPFIAGALVSAPIAYLAGNNNTPEYVFPPQQFYQQYQPYPYQVQYQPYLPYGYQPQIQQTFYPQINQNPL